MSDADSLCPLFHHYLTCVISQLLQKVCQNWSHDSFYTRQVKIFESERPPCSACRLLWLRRSRESLLDRISSSRQRAQAQRDSHQERINQQVRINPDRHSLENVHIIWSTDLVFLHKDQTRPLFVFSSVYQYNYKYSTKHWTKEAKMCLLEIWTRDRIR